LWAKELYAKDIHKEMFSVCVGRCLSPKAVHNWAEKFSQGHSKVVDNALPSAEVAETTVKNFYAARFDALIRPWDKCVNVSVGYVEK
jgi:hypothetical protein